MARIVVSPKLRLLAVGSLLSYDFSLQARQQAMELFEELSDRALLLAGTENHPP